MGGEKPLEKKEMWPSNPEEGEEFDKTIHFCQLRKATLHFALYGLRDAAVQRPVTSEEEAPTVKVQVKKFSKDTHHSGGGQEAKKKNYFTMNFEYSATNGSLGGAKDVKDDQLLRNWKSDSLGRKDCWNCEMLQVQKKNILLPDKALLQPSIAIQVHERPLKDPFLGTTLRKPSSSVNIDRALAQSFLAIGWGA